MKKLTALAAALMLGTAAFAAVDGAKEGKKDKAGCCEKCKDGACKDKAEKAPEKKG
jgi:hypothetical protein